MLGDEMRRYAVEIMLETTLGSQADRPPVRCVVDGDSVRVERWAHRDEGRGHIQATVADAFDGDQVRAQVAATVAAMATSWDMLEARRRTVAATGWDPDLAPPWAFRAEALAVAVMRHRGHDPLLLAAHPHGGRREGETGLQGGYEDEKARDGLPAAWTRHHGRDAHLVRRLPEGAEGFGYSDLKGRVLVHVDEPIPETLLHALVGRPLSDLLGHPCFADPSFVVQRVEINGAGRRFVELRSHKVALADAPEGVDRWWLGLHQAPRSRGRAACRGEARHGAEKEGDFGWTPIR